MNYRIGLAAGMAGYFLFAWVATSMLKLTGIDLWMVRGFLCLFGVSGAGIYLWWRSRREQQQAPSDGGAAAAGQPGPGGVDEIDLIVRDADARVAASNIARGARVANLPAIFLVGPPGAAKTHTMLHSGLEPELLGGQVYQDNTVLPTRSVNLWFARQTVFAEAGGRLILDPARWIRLVKRLAPGRLGTVVGKGEQAPRAAVVCFDLEEFIKPGANEAVPAAVRNLHARLGEISQTLGISFPVYVMFTRSDRVPFFLDYVRNLSNEEAGQVLGVTLPIQAGQQTGVYAEQATHMLGALFDELFYSLSDKRVPLLAREHAADKLPGTYEFPREFRKLRGPLVQFLVDISKPSQLRAAPFLRGFYFSGVRPVVVTDVAPQASMRQAERSAFDQHAGATGLFRAGGMQQAPPTSVTQGGGGTRRAPQWIFLSHFWNDILLADRAAISTSSASLKTSLLRRILLATAGGLCLLYSLALVVSYFQNHALESRVLEAARATATIPASSQQAPTLESLKRLEGLRQELATLGLWEREGAPFSYRWGLYTGSDLYPDVYRLYFARFHSMLFGATQAGVLESLRRLPSTPSPTDEYAPPYNALKAYLITTSEWKRSTRPFLAPYLGGRWVEGKTLDPERLQLAQKQFDFYSEELRLKNPYSTENDGATVDGARRYLKQFNADARIYQALIEEASRRTPSVNYNRLFPNEAVNDPREVRGAFTKDGWAFMQAAFRKPDQIFGGEDWVLGPQSFANLDRSQLEQRLRGFYYPDFVKEWREFLKAAAVARYSNLEDAAKKLSLVSANQSPLLALFCLVSQHTSVDEPTVKLAFQAPQQVVPQACQSQYVGGSNQTYMQNLLGLQASVQQVASSAAGANDPAAAQTRQLASAALLNTGQIAQTFAIDKEGNVPATVKKLMEDPITQVDRLLAGMGPAELRAKGQALCGQFNALMAKYPFNLKSTVQATIDDVNRFFRPPDGALWQFHSQSLQALVQKDGAQYVGKSGSVMSVTPGFLGFFNRAAAFSEAAYPAGAQQPKINFTLRSDLTGSTQSSAVTLDGQTFSFVAGKAAGGKFTWPGNPPGATMQVKFGAEAFNWPRYDGTWATFDFFGDSDERGQPSPGVYRLEWTLRTGQSGRTVTTGTGQPVVVRFDLDMMGSPPVFRKGYFSGWGCVADVAR